VFKEERKNVLWLKKKKNSNVFKEERKRVLCLKKKGKKYCG